MPSTKDVRIRCAEAELEQSIVMVLRKEPFYGHLLCSVVRRLDSDIPTAAVTLSPVGVSLVVNPDFFLTTLSSDERCAVIKHEILHLVLRHLFRFEEPGMDRTLLNLAADIVVNQLVHPWPLPSGAITLATFPELNLRPNKSVEHYYKALASKSGDAGFSKRVRQLKASSPSHHERWADRGGEGFSAEAKGEQLTPELNRILEEGFSRQLQRARERLSERQWSSVPSSIRTLLEQKQSKGDASIDWGRALRLFASAGYRTRVSATSRRRSRRFGTYPGVRIRRERRLAVVVDTSGSIGAQELKLFFAEIDRIHRTGAEVVVIEADARVTATYPYRGVIPVKVHGGGGTDFSPAMHWLRHESSQRFDGCIYLTDGYADAPTVQPPCRLLWVITPTGQVGEHLLWGKQIQMRS